MSSHCAPDTRSLLVTAQALLAGFALAAAAFGAHAADKPVAGPGGIKAASCLAKSGGPSQCSRGEKCLEGRCVPDLKGPKSGPIEKR